MKNTISKITFITMTLTTPLLVSAQSSMNELLEHMQIHEDTPLMELNVGQLVQIIQFTPLMNPVCADFSSFNINQMPYSYGQTITINGIKFTAFYGTGVNPAARISEWPNYPGDLFLEMVEDGYMTIEFPVPASDVILSLIQGGNHPNDIEYFSHGSHVGNDHTNLYNYIDTIGFASNNVTSVTIRNPELLIKEVCYQ